MLTFFLGLVNSIVLVVIHSAFALIKHLTPMALWPKSDLTGEIGLVTGAGSGIGREVALHLSQRGCKLVLWDINAEGNNETARLIRNGGGEATAYTCDVADRERIYKLAREVERDIGRVTVLVNNAGIVNGRKLLDLPDCAILDTFNVNTLSHYWTLKAFLPSMIAANRGHVVTVSSILAEKGVPWCSDYCASKAAVRALHESAAREVILRGCSDIHFTLICPNLTLKAFLPSMIAANRGHVVTVSSILAEKGIPWCSDYCASKAAVKALHETAAREVILRGCSDIHFTLICPYLVTSGLFRGVTVRYNWLLPSLTPEYVGRKITEALLTGQDVLYLPYRIQLFTLIMYIIPFRAQLVLEDFMGASTGMATFTGRQKEA